MRIFLIESYYSGSHKQWANGLIDYSVHDIQLFTLKGRFWKWRMQGSAITLSEEVNKEQKRPDLIVCSDLIDIASFRSLIKFKDVKLILYMHENQLTYPISKYSKDEYQEISYGYLNYKSCLCSDYVLFNSHYHKRVFIEACEKLLSKMPDHNNLNSIDIIKERSEVIPVGINVDIFSYKTDVRTKLYDSTPTLLYNHRWEHDKRPDVFIRLLDDLIFQKLDFRVNITNIKDNQTIKSLINQYGDRINFVGYCSDRIEYLNILSSSDILPVTGAHDFFGISVLEAMYLSCQPILPSNLCYQEHFNKYNSSIYYESYEGLLKLTGDVILNHGKKEFQKFNPNFLKNYSWEQIINIYDMFFENITTHS